VGGSGLRDRRGAVRGRGLATRRENPDPWQSIFQESAWNAFGATGSGGWVPVPAFFFTVSESGPQLFSPVEHRVETTGPARTAESRSLRTMGTFEPIVLPVGSNLYVVGGADVRPVRYP
jgi:hypothetical protein